MRSAETTGDSELLRQLHEVPEAQRGSFLTEYLQREVQQFLRLAQPPAATSRFLDLGTDSLMAVELRNRLYRQFGGAFTISATAVFDYPTIGRSPSISPVRCPSRNHSRARRNRFSAESSSESVAGPEPGLGIGCGAGVRASESVRAEPS